MNRVLVAYGSTNGSTAEIADVIAETLRSRRLAVDLRPADAVTDVHGYDGVVLGGAIYMDRWHRASRRFARRFAGDLTMIPVWLFSSGPLDESAESAILDPVASVARAARLLDARGHATFGGCLIPEARGCMGMARRMGKRAAADFRNFDRIRAWASDIAVELGTPAIHLLAI